MNATAQRPLDTATLAHFSAAIEASLKRTIARVAAQKAFLPTGAIVEQVFVTLFGPGRSVSEHLCFYVFAAPLMRRLVVDYLLNCKAGQSRNLGMQEMDHWLEQLEAIDPVCLKMIELHYFAGLGIRSTATALATSPQEVVDKLRFAKAWLQARISWGTA